MSLSPHTSLSVFYLLPTMELLYCYCMVLLNSISPFESYFTSVLSFALPCLLRYCSLILLDNYFSGSPSTRKVSEIYTTNIYKQTGFTLLSKVCEGQNDHIFIALLCYLLHEHKDPSNLLSTGKRLDVQAQSIGFNLQLLLLSLLYLEHLTDTYSVCNHFIMYSPNKEHMLITHALAKIKHAQKAE